MTYLATTTLASAITRLSTTPFPPGDPNAPAPLDDATAATANGIALMFLFLMLAVALASFVVWVYTIIDAARRDEGEWAAAGKNKVLWIVLIAVLGVLASLVYLVAARPALKEAARKQRAQVSGGFTPPTGYGTSPYGQIPAAATYPGPAGHGQMPATAADEAYPSTYPQQPYASPATYPAPQAAPQSTPSPNDWRGSVYQPPSPPTAG